MFTRPAVMKNINFLDKAYIGWWYHLNQYAPSFKNMYSIQMDKSDSKSLAMCNASDRIFCQKLPTVPPIPVQLMGDAKC